MTDTPSHVIRDVLVNDHDLFDLIGDHVFPNSLPSGEKIPCIIFRFISKIPQDFSQTPSGALLMARIQFDCWADKHGDAEKLACTLCAALRSCGLGIEVINSFDATPAPELESEGRWRYIVEAYSWHEED